MAAFLREISSRVPDVEDVESLRKWSVEEPAEFWGAVVDFCGVRFSRAPETVVRDVDRMPGATWFPGGELNYAAHLLDALDDDRPALVAWNERGRADEVPSERLRREVAALQAAFDRWGLVPGDRVAGYLPNRPEPIVAMLAAASRGLVWSSCSPDFGVRGVLDRFGQIRPKVLIAGDGWDFGGRTHDARERVRDVAARLPGLERTIVVPVVGSGLSPSELPGGVAWDEVVAGGPAEPDFLPVPFSHPLAILYSSGTTGLPKCMVHGHGGTLVQHLKELVLHTDVHPGDRLFYFTTCGWMMWNWMATGLGAGATLLLYDGSPLKPRTGILFDLAERERMTHFGTSAKYLAMAEKEGLRPRESHELGALRTILSTGSPLAPESYDWVYRHVREDVALASISGGTDLVSCFALGNPMGPVHRGELQMRGLGMAVEVWNEDAQPVVGEAGELVCTRAFPSMPVAFWDDPDGARYRSAYFEHFPGVWRHGDWAELTPRGGLVIHGRSDATLNPGGVRIGSAEITRRVEVFDEVVEALAVGQEIGGGDVRVVLFVRLRPGVELDPDLVDRIRRELREKASPHHVPRVVCAVEDLPRTRSGKVSEIAVRKVIHGRQVENREALANPEALEHFRDRFELALD